jgi:hypothetical protein
MNREQVINTVMVVFVDSDECFWYTIKQVNLVVLAGSFPLHYLFTLYLI